MNNNRWLQALIILLVIIATSWLAGQLWTFVIQFSSIILLFFLAWLLAFALGPLARGLQSFGMPQGLASALVYLGLLVIVVLIGIPGFQALAQQIQQLIDQTPAYTRELERLGNQTLAQAQSWGVRVEDIHLDTFYGTMGDQVKNVGGSVLGFVTGLAGVLFNMIIILLLSFYFMSDGERMFNNLVRALPPSIADEMQLLGDALARAFGGFLRGQLVFAVLYAVLNGVIMAAFQLDYILLASIVAGLMMLIPLIGGNLAYIPPVLILLVTKTDAGNWWLLLLVLFIVQTLMMQVVSPRIMSQAIGMHPLFVVAALLVGLQVAGFWGALFGIPAAGVVYQVMGPYFARLRSFFDVPGAEEPALSLHVTMPVSAVTLTSTEIVPPADGAEASTPGRAAGAPASAPSSLFMAVRGLTRRTGLPRRRPRP